ncbi:MAG TPA: M56 family metallopeptidase [Longimicrobium sp.]|nr:M56 family metallopeptidase [Longimicrobium sp.]
MSFDLPAVFAALADAAVKGTVILLAALVATRLMRRRSAASRHLVWMVALASMLALPLATRILPAWRVVPVPAPLRPAATFVAPDAPVATLPVANAPESVGDLVVTPVVRTDKGIESAAPQPSASASAPASPAESASFDWKMALLVLWAVGGAALALRLAYGLARVWWMQRRAVEIEDEEWVHITDRLARKLRVGRLVTLLREAHAVVPMTWGIVRPVVLLPSDAEEWDSERRTVVLAHELAHVRRWDTLTQWIAHLALALFWFHPLVWVAARRMREEREHACDDAVLSIGTRPVEYADHLLSIVRSLGTAEGPAAALAMARRSQFEGRLLAILDGATPRGGVTRGLGFAALAAAAMAVLPLAALRPAEAAPASAAVAQVQAPTTKSVPDSSARDQRLIRSVLRALTGHAVPEKAVATAAETAPATVAERTEHATEPTEPASRETPAPVQAPQPAQTPVQPPASPTTVATAAKPLASTSAGLLSTLQERSDPGLYAAIIRAANDIQSATERRLVLVAVLEKSDLSRGNVTEIIRSTQTMPSSTEKRLVLQEAINHRAFPVNPLPHEFYQALATFSSSSEKRLVMEALLERHQLRPDCLTLLFAELRGMSNGDQRLVLTTVAQTQPMTAANREAFVTATRSIDSDGERRLALDALMNAASSRGETAAGRGRRESVWSSNNQFRDGKGREVTIHASRVIYGRGPWDILRIQPGGRLMVQEERGGTVRRLTAVPGGDGKPVYTYTLDGQAYPVNNAVQTWFQGLIRDFISN